MKKSYLLSQLLLANLLAFCPACHEQAVDLQYSVEVPLRSTAALQTFNSCDELEARLKKNLKNELMTRVLEHKNYDYYIVGSTYDDRRYVKSEPVYDDAESAPNSANETLTAGVDYSTTNNQEAGVDEADFVKTDGNYIYVLNSIGLFIFEVPVFGELRYAGLASVDGYAESFFIDGTGQNRRAVVFSQTYNINDLPGLPADGDNYNGYNYEKITVYDLSNPSAPVVDSEFLLTGYMLDARNHSGVVRYVNSSSLNTYLPTDLEFDYNGAVPLEPGQAKYEAVVNKAINERIASNNEIISRMTLADFLPHIYYREGDDWQEMEVTEESCKNVQIATDGVSHGFNSIITFKLGDSREKWRMNHLVSDASVLYASKNDLILAEPAQSYWWYWSYSAEEEATNIHRFDISSPLETKYSGSARIPGTIEDQFALSEDKGIIRAAVTIGNWNRWWLNGTGVSHSMVYTLGDVGGVLEILGHTPEIAPGERLYSVRFDGDKGYLVTFRNMDPLWTVDLHDPAAPAIIGELQVPGVSTYIHPLDGDRFLLTIGYGGDDNNLNWVPQISLFDVTDFAKPRLADSLSLGEEYSDNEHYYSYSSSSALYEHKAFQYWGPMNLLAVPLSLQRYYYNDGYDYTWEYLSLLDLVSVDTAAAELSLYQKDKTIDHSDYFQQSFWAYGSDIRRSIFMGEYVYAISDVAVTCHHLTDMEQTGVYRFGK